MLSDGAWVRIAGEVMDRTGLSRYREDDDGLRWVAVQHADDHIHIVATLARQDRVRLRCTDWYRIGRPAGRRIGATAWGRPPGPIVPAPASVPGREREAAPAGAARGPRVTLRRHVAAAAAGPGGPAEFFAALGPPRCWSACGTAPGNPGEVTGYAVALPGMPGRRAARGGSGAASGPDLTRPRLRHRWPGLPRAGPGPVTAPDRDALFEHAARVAGQAAAQIRGLARAKPSSLLAHAAWAASDLLHATAAALGSDVLRQAADSFATGPPVSSTAGSRHPGRPVPAWQAARLILGACAAPSRDLAPTWPAAHRPAGRTRRGRRRAAQGLDRHAGGPSRPAPPPWHSPPSGRPARAGRPDASAAAGSPRCRSPARPLRAGPSAALVGAGPGRAVAAPGLRPGSCHRPGPAALAAANSARLRAPGSAFWLAGGELLRRLLRPAASTMPCMVSARLPRAAGLGYLRLLRSPAVPACGWRRRTSSFW